jgi:hypothetical protein
MAAAIASLMQRIRVLEQEQRSLIDYADSSSSLRVMRARAEVLTFINIMDTLKSLFDYAHKN